MKQLLRGSRKFMATNTDSFIPITKVRTADIDATTIYLNRFLRILKLIGFLGVDIINRLYQVSFLTGNSTFG
jgi:hypothetical protein